MSRRIEEHMVYVDPLAVFGTDCAPTCFRHKPSCHMYADSLEELHAMAQEIGLKRSWFQDHRMLAHYDLTPFMRQRAIRKGAIAQTRREAVEKWRSLRTTPDWLKKLFRKAEEECNQRTASKKATQSESSARGRRQ